VAPFEFGGHIATIFDCRRVGHGLPSVYGPAVRKISSATWPDDDLDFAASVWGATAMNERLNWMLPSVSAGRLFSTDIRISWWFALVLVVIWPRYGIALGLAFTALLYVSVLLHEFAHVFAARWTGGAADEIHLTPMGGIAFVKPGHGAFGLGITAAAGPLVNLVICICSFPGWYAPETLWGSLNPFVMPIQKIGTASLWHDLALLLFTANWIGLLVNLLPVVPLDGGQILRAILSTRIHPELVQRTAVHVGLFVALAILVGGVMFDKSQVVLIGTFVLLVNVVQLFQEQTGEAMDDSAFGYDFSSGYESLERSNPTATRESKVGLLQRWRERRRLRREQQDRIRRMEAEQQLDSLLAKVHEHGLPSLSVHEQKLLRDCSELLRERGKSDS
jgi:stage IV sporulation protein FB